MELNYNSAQVDVENQQPKLPAGTVVASRFRVEALLGTGGLGPLYRAQDLESDRPVALRMLAQDLCQNETLLERLRGRVKDASRLQHKNIARVFGMGVDGGHRFIAMELIEGRSLRDLLAKRRSAHRAFSLKAAYNIIAHICNALSESHKVMPHGLVGPGAVLINQVGRIKVCEFGVVQAFPPGSPGFSRLGDCPYAAPEVTQTPAAAGPAADIYSAGVTLHELLTGQPPSREVPPSQMCPHLGPVVDDVISRCIQHDPGARYRNPDDVKAAFYAAMQASSDADADRPARSPLAPGQGGAPAAGAVGPRPAPPPPELTPPGPTQPAPMRPGPVQPGAAQPFGAPGAPGHPGQPGAAPRIPLPQPLQIQPRPNPLAPPLDQTTQREAMLASQRPVDIKALLADTGGDQTEKWLIQKDRLDFGPFSLGDLKQQLYRQEFTGDDVVVDQETGERGRIRNHAALREFIIHLERHLDSQRATEAEANRMDQDRRRRAILVGAVAGCLAILAIGVAIAAYYYTKKPETQERIVYRERDNLGKMIKGIGITWKKEPEDQAKKRKKLRRKRRRAGRGRGHDDDVTRLGDATKQGGDALLSQKVVQNVMAQNFNRLKMCVVNEARRNPSLRQVVIEFGVRGTGRVSSVKVNGKRTGPFQGCIFKRMQGIKFPSFDGQLTRAVFSMNLQY